MIRRGEFRTIVDNMTTEEEVSKNREELNKAREGICDNLTEVSSKVEHLEGKLRLDRLIKRSSIAATCMAGALGVVIGSRAQPSAVGPVMIPHARIYHP
jgi:hypothetical protein